MAESDRTIEGTGSTMVVRAIGHVESEIDESTPYDSMESIESLIVLDPSMIDGALGLKPGQEITVVYWFHRSDGYELRQHPKGDRNRPKRGVFTLRSPHRPNPIGITRVRLVALQENVLRVRGLDAIDGTPVLDLKP